MDTNTLDYCSSSIIDNCTILEPTEALIGSNSDLTLLETMSINYVLTMCHLIGSTEGTLFVNTMVKYSAETCTSCSSTATGWVAPVSSAVTSSLYTVSKTNTFFVAGVEDYEVAVQHGGMVRWGYDKAAEYFGTVKTMSGALLGKNSGQVVKKFSSSNTYDSMTVAQLLKAAGVSLCDGSDCSNTDTRFTGGTILVELRYKNRIGHTVPEINEEMDYYYHCTLLPSLESNKPVETYPDLTFPYGYSRVKIERTGVTVVFNLTGGIGKFNFEKGWVYFAGGCFMFVVVDYLFQLM